MENASVQKNIKNQEKDITCDILKAPNDRTSSPINYIQKASDSKLLMFLKTCQKCLGKRENKSGMKCKRCNGTGESN